MLPGSANKGAHSVELPHLLTSLTTNVEPHVPVNGTVAQDTAAAGHDASCPRRLNCSCTTVKKQEKAIQLPRAIFHRQLALRIDQATFFCQHYLWRPNQIVRIACEQALWWTVISAEISSITLLCASGQIPEVARLIECLQLKGGNLENIRFTPVFLFGALVTCTSALLRLWCYRLLGDLFTFDINIKKGHRLVSTGPYSIVRHPSYTAGTLNYCGLFLAFAAPVRDCVQSLVLGCIQPHAHAG